MSVMESVPDILVDSSGPVCVCVSVCLCVCLFLCVCLSVMESVPDIPVDSSGHVLSCVCLCVYVYVTESAADIPTARCHGLCPVDAAAETTDTTTPSPTKPAGRKQLSHTLILYYQV